MHEGFDSRSGRGHFSVRTLTLLSLFQHVFLHRHAGLVNLLRKKLPVGINCALSVKNWRPVQRVLHLLTGESRAGLQTSVTVCEVTSLHLCPVTRCQAAASPFSLSLAADLTLHRCILGAAPASLLNLRLLECADAGTWLHSVGGDASKTLEYLRRFLSRSHTV